MEVEESNCKSSDSNIYLKEPRKGRRLGAVYC